MQIHRRLSFKHNVLSSIILLFLLALSFDLRAQETGALRGQVVDENGEPLPGANVVLKSTQKGTATDNDGQFLLRDLPTGDQVIVFSFIGYENKEINISIRPGKVVERDISLTPRNIQSDELVIQAQRDILRTLQTKRLSTEMVDVIDVETVQ